MENAQAALDTGTFEPTGIRDDAAHILLVDDDRRIRGLLSQYLVEHGFRVTTADSAAAASARMRGLTFDLMILDIMMPGKSGLEFTGELRKHDDIPILMLTARSEPEQRIEGLELGVDDYLGKPFEPREMLLRIGNILKRRQPIENDMPEICKFADLTYNTGSGELKRGEDSIRLTERERELLSIFVLQSGKTVSRIDLADAGIAGSERAVDVQVNRLRRKIEADPGNPLILQTVRGVGYRLHAQ
ncbi:MAG: response regulator transcription factor [Fimbriimonadaceae bacterium]|nr:response regulator transcription factor [Alphaproteobacteria bacterium]